MKIIAHRGASGEYPENSLLAFEKAIEQGADGIELDAQYHVASGKFVLLHDSYLDKTTNGKGDLNRLTLDELKALDLGHNEKLVTLPQALAAINGRVFVNIELKTVRCSSQNLQDIIAELNHVLTVAIQENNFSLEQFVISSFDHHLLSVCKQHIKQLRTAALIAHRPIDYSDFAKTLEVSGINPDIDCIHQCLVDDAHQQSLSVWVYTVDRREDIEHCLTIGVDGIFTNFPRKSRDLLDKARFKLNF